MKTAYAITITVVSTFLVIIILIFLCLKTHRQDGRKHPDPEVRRLAKVKTPRGATGGGEEEVGIAAVGNGQGRGKGKGKVSEWGRRVSN